MNHELNYTGVGLNTDSHESQIKKGQLTFANNAVVESWDGKLVTYQNERSNYKKIEFESGMFPIGIFHITNIDRVVYFLTNGDSKHQIAYTDNESSSYTVLLEAPCLNFSVNHPIHQVVVKNTNCGVEIYWTDAYNKMRYLNFEDLPFKEIPDPNNDFKKIKVVGDVDCNKLLAQPTFRIPRVVTQEVVEGGRTVEGSYQFVVQYANSRSESYSQFYNITNPISISDADRASLSFNLETSKAIRLKVEKLDTSGLFDYFNLVVIENINAISTPKLVGTYPITSDTQEVLFTGQTNTSIQLSMEEIFQKYLKYDVAGGVTSTDNRIVWYDLKENHRTNYQSVWSNIKLYWESYLIPYDDQNAYKNAINTEKYKGVMRDEVYPYEGVFVLRNGKETDRCPLVGRLPTQSDLTLVNGVPSWKAYNTASVLQSNTPTPYQPYQLGEFAFWESEETYPNTHEIWGQLSGQKIRHFRFPDELVSKRFITIDNKEYICPMGVKIFKADLINAIAQSTLTEEQKSEIIGFKILRGDRTSGNSSIVAKGHFSNVGKYKENDNTYYFSNYPYNDLGPDPLFAEKEISPMVGYSAQNALKPFEDNPLNRLTFHSPDTHFTQPFGIDSGFVKLEAIDYGESKSRFVKINNNAEYKFLTKESFMVSVGLAAGVAFDYSRNGEPEFNGTDAMAVFQSNVELFEKLSPYTNFGYNVNSIANFNNTFSIPNTEKKEFGIDFGKYINSEYNTIDDGNIINNKYRESSVVVKLDNEVKKAHEYDESIPLDNSKVIASERATMVDVSTEEFFNKLVQNDTEAVRFLTLGLLEGASNLSNGDDNLALKLLPIMGAVLQGVLDTSNFGNLQNLKNRQVDCNTSTCHSVNLPLYELDVPQLSKISYVITLPYSNVVDEVEQVLNFSATTIALSNICSNQVISVPYSPSEFVPSQQDVDNTYSQTLANANVTNVDLEEEQVEIFSFLLLGVYGNTSANVCGGAIFNEVYNSVVLGAKYYSDLYTTIEARKKLSTERVRNANAYYGSIKRNLPAQWGRVHSYEVVDTGVYYELEDEEYPTIFGGDTFINKFSFKTKLPVYKKSTVNTPNNADIALNEEGSLGRPMFWVSTKPLDYDFQFSQRDLEMSLGGIGLTNIKAFTGSILQSIGTAVMGVGAVASLTVVGTVAGVIIAAVGGILYVVGAIFKNTRSKLQKASMRLYKSLFQQIIEKLGQKNINLDVAQTKGIAHKGIIYQYVYGIPSYFVESQVNVDLRQATNDKEGNYYPRVGNNIPDDWLQEDNVSIQYDNVYHYNKTFSKQNRENFYSYLREDYDFSKDCFQYFQNRAMWSDQTNLNETLNNWLIYRPLNQFDFPKEYGKLTALNGILNRQVLARFENKSQLYNTMTRIDTNTISAYVGSPELFKGQPAIDLVDTDNGSMGSQHKWSLRTEMGIVFIDSERGQVVLLQGNNPKILSDIDNEKFFKENLPFYIKKSFPSINIDNHYKDLGLHGVYDVANRRLLITKLDYEVIDSRVKYLNGKFYVDNNIVLLTDTRYFCNRSWTMSFSFRTNSWVSYHSYTPNTYVSFPTYFQSVNRKAVYNHEKVFDSFCVFYGSQEPYILEYPFHYKQQDEILQTVMDYTSSQRYTDFDTSYEPDETLYFNKAFIRSRQQNTGLLNLIPQQNVGITNYLQYPKHNSDSKDILVSRRDNIMSFNSFWDITKDKTKPTTKIGCNKIDIDLDNTNLEYTPMLFKKYPLRAKDLKIRLIRDKATDFKMVSNFVVTETQTSQY